MGCSPGESYIWRKRDQHQKAESRKQQREHTDAKICQRSWSNWRTIAVINRISSRWKEMVRITNRCQKAEPSRCIAEVVFVKTCWSNAQKPGECTWARKTHKSRVKVLEPGKGRWAGQKEVKVGARTDAGYQAKLLPTLHQKRERYHQGTYLWRKYI